MNINQFFKLVKLQEPLYCVHGDILETPAKHIAFAVHYPNSKGEFDNSGGFAGDVAQKYWPELVFIKFTKGEPISRYADGKYWHAMPVHSNETNGWEEAPILIEDCLNKLPVNSTEVIASVLIGGGVAGKKWGANIKNISGMLNSIKTVVLYVYETELFQILVGTGIVAACLNKGKLKQFRVFNGESVDDVRRVLTA